MLIVISPAKTLDFSPTLFQTYTQPRQLKQSQNLVDTIKQLNPQKLASLLKISKKLSLLNWQRYQDFHQPFTLKNAKQALLAFKGDVYKGINAYDYADADLYFSQKHLRILSGLYGVLKPLDLIQPYRLDMGTKLNYMSSHNLYEFWNIHITNMLNQDLKDTSPLLINLASNEYYKAIKSQALKGQILTLNFKENRNGKFKIISIYAKRARGLMADFIIKNRLTKAEQIKEFQEEKYTFNGLLSSATEWVFSR